MDKNIFNSLPMDQQVKTFNELLKGSSIRKVCAEIGIGKTTIRDRFKKHDYVYDSAKNQYFKGDNLIEKEIKINKNISDMDNQEIERNNNLAIVSKSEKFISCKSDIEKMYSDMKELLDLKNELKALIEKDKQRENIIELPQLHINKFTGNLTSKSIKVYSDVLDLFDKFMDEHKGLKQQDVISQALWEFLKKYK